MFGVGRLFSTSGFLLKTQIFGTRSSIVWPFPFTPCKPQKPPPHVPPAFLPSALQYPPSPFPSCPLCSSRPGNLETSPPPARAAATSNPITPSLRPACERGGCPRPSSEIELRAVLAKSKTYSAGAPVKALKFNFADGEARQAVLEVGLAAFSIWLLGAAADVVEIAWTWGLDRFDFESRLGHLLLCEVRQVT